MWCSRAAVSNLSIDRSRHPKTAATVAVVFSQCTQMSLSLRVFHSPLFLRSLNAQNRRTRIERDREARGAPLAHAFAWVSVVFFLLR